MAIVPGAMLAFVASMALATDDPSAGGERSPGPGVLAAQPGRLVVRFDDYPAGLEVGSSFEGARVVAAVPALGFLAVVTDDAKAFEERASRDGRVISVELDSHASISDAFVPNDPLAPTQYALGLVGLPEAWSKGTGSLDVIICVIDTGVRYTHEDLAGRFAGGFDFVNNDNDPFDDNGHGTHVTGIAAASINNALGIAGAANARFTHAKVLDASGVGFNTDVASGIVWCADHGAHVISLSLGSLFPSFAVELAVDYAWAQGALIVAAAGNKGPCVDCVDFPAAFANVVGVACVDQFAAQCSFSSSGPEVDISAPGLAILSTCFHSDSSYCLLSGTSMSTPMVSGVAALLKARAPWMTNQELNLALLQTALDLGPITGRDDDFGEGLVAADVAIVPPPCPQTSVQGEGSDVLVSWNAVPPTTPGGVVYHVYRAVHPGGEDVLIGATGETSFLDTTTEVGLTYAYHARAFEDGFESTTCSTKAVITAVPFFQGAAQLLAAGASGAALVVLLRRRAV